MPIGVLTLPAAGGPLQALAKVLLPEMEPGSIADLSTTLVVLPGGHAIERLRQRLVQRAAELDLCLLPPDCCTPGQLVNRTIPEHRRSASAMAIRQAWRRAVEELGSPWGTSRSTPAGTSIPEGLLDHLTDLSSDCGGALLTFGDIASRSPTLGEHFESEPWQRMKRLQARMIDLLDECGLEHPSMRALELLREESPALLWSNTRRIIAVLADPSRVQRQILRVAARQGLQVQVAIHAAASGVPDAVDAEGFPNPAAWTECPIDIDPGRIKVVDGPAELAQGTADLVEGNNPVVCLPDANLLSGLTKGLGGDRRVRAIGQRQFADCRLGTLIRSLHLLTTEWSWAAFAAFVRHPDAAEWLKRETRQTRLVQAVTTYRLKSLAACLDEATPPHLADDFERVRPALEAAIALTKKLRSDILGIAKWADALAHAVQTIVGDCAAGNSPGERAESVRYLLDALSQLRDLPAALSPASAAERFQLLANALEGSAISPAADEDAVECLGWLECGMHDGGRLIFAGMNEGALPARAVSDPWLPDGARQRLGMPTSATQYARDSWILHSLLSAEGADIHFIVARRNAAGDALHPSRLLLRPYRADGESLGSSLATRVLQLVSTSAKPRPEQANSAAAGLQFARQPLPVGAGELAHISVTQFADWLISPRLFQFKHDPRLKLSVREDVDVGLDSSAFGSLAHEVMSRFGAAQMRDGHATTALDAWAALQSALTDTLADRFTSEQREALRPELESLEARLRRLAPQQAEHARQGWQIRHVELPVKALCPGVTPAQRQIELLGRIDRLDLHPEHGWLALDYKTRTRAESAADSHRKRDGTWTDLQLPLYRYLLQQSPGYAGRITVGLVGLPEEAANHGFSLAPWSDADFDSAIQCAADIVQRILNGDFVEGESPTEGLYDLAALWGQTLRGGEDES